MMKQSYSFRACAVTCISAAIIILAVAVPHNAWSAAHQPEVRTAPLPFSKVFKGDRTFKSLLKKAKKEKWKSIPFSDRVAKVGLALVGTRYESFTLDLDDHIEAPSVNFDALDCWTFFETSLALARMIELPETDWTPQNLLRYIEFDRYRNGHCDGSYLSRLHYLADWMHDNVRRGWVTDMSRQLGGERIYRDCFEMTNARGIRCYRILRNNPHLIPLMRDEESRISNLEVWHIPKSRVAEIEPRLQNGDILCITSKYQGAFCSHVGLALRDQSGVLRFMHATSEKPKGRKVILDARISDYLDSISAHAGIMVARPYAFPSKAR